MEPTETIDAVAMTRSIREAHAEQLRGSTPAERIRFYREKAARLDGTAGKQLQNMAEETSPADARR